MDNPTLFNNSMIKGTVDAILFQNKDNFYTVLKVDTIESNEDFEISFTFPCFIKVVQNSYIFNNCFGLPNSEK